MQYLEVLLISHALNVSLPSAVAVLCNYLAPAFLEQELHPGPCRHQHPVDPAHPADAGWPAVPVHTGERM